MKKKDKEHMNESFHQLPILPKPPYGVCALASLRGNVLQLWEATLRKPHSPIAIASVSFLLHTHPKDVKNAILQAAYVLSWRVACVVVADEVVCAAWLCVLPVLQ